jgi:glucose-1-phosphate thymidylyltransferase
MKVIILAAGYATRLYPLTINKPKALLPINDIPILDYIINEVEYIDAIDEIFVISNHKFYKNFADWKETRKSNKAIKIIDDMTTDDSNKLGAIGDINLVLQSESINDDILVIAGDNFFTFKMYDFYDFYREVGSDCILVKEINDYEQLKRMGVVQLDNDYRVIDMEEKPNNPKSNIAAFASYIYEKDTLPLFGTYLNEGNNPDAPGFFPSWLYKRKPVHAYIFDGECYDIGTPEAYKEVNRKYKSKL